MKIEKIYCIKCNKYRKSKNLKRPYIFDKTLVLSIICGKCGSNDDNIADEEESTVILIIFGLINNINEKKYVVPNAILSPSE